MNVVVFFSFENSVTACDKEICSTLVDALLPQEVLLQEISALSNGHVKNPL